MSNSEYMNYFIEKGIFEDRLEFVRDFLFTLLHTIDGAHIGDKYLTSIELRRGHFQWALRKVCNFYNSKGINIQSNDKLSKGLFKFFLEDYYTQDAPSRKDIFLRKYKRVLMIDAENKIKNMKTLQQIYDLVENNMGA